MYSLEFRKAQLSELDEILSLYNNLIDEMEKTTNYPKWTKGYYPDYNYLKEKQNLGQLFVLLGEDKEIISVVILNQDSISDYDNVNWSQKLRPKEVLFMHTFAVKHNLRGQRIGDEVIKAIIDYAKENGIKSLRCDTINGNTPAQHFYTRVGFNDLGIYELNYAETDEKYFNLFELEL